MHAGFGDPPIESRAYRAGKLAKRATDFANVHAKPLALGDLGGKITDLARQLGEGCEALNPDPGPIRKMTVDLGNLTGAAVARVYPAPRAKGTAADKSESATSEVEAHPSAPARSPRRVGTDV
jgi:hypothetical protein